MHTGIHPLMREPVAQAEIRYRSEEEKGHWHEWRPVNADSVPPWWYAGADYTWEVVLAFVDAFMQHTWATDFDSEVERELLETAGDTFAEKLIHYESGQHRKPQFVSFVRVQLAARRAKLTRERWQKAAPPQPQTERAIANGAAVRALPGPVPTVVETAYAQSSPADVLGTVAGTAGELAAPGVEGREARKVLRDAYKAECKKGRRESHG